MVFLTFEEIVEWDNLDLIHDLFISKHGNSYRYIIKYWNECIKTTTQVCKNTANQFISSDMISKMSSLTSLVINSIDDDLCLDIPLNEGIHVDIDNCPNITFVNKNQE